MSKIVSVFNLLESSEHPAYAVSGMGDWSFVGSLTELEAGQQWLLRKAERAKSLGSSRFGRRVGECARLGVRVRRGWPREGGRQRTDSWNGEGWEGTIETNYYFINPPPHHNSTFFCVQLQFRLLLPPSLPSSLTEEILHSLSSILPSTLLPPVTFNSVSCR